MGRHHYTQQPGSRGPKLTISPVSAVSGLHAVNGYERTSGGKAPRERLLSFALGGSRPEARLARERNWRFGPRPPAKPNYLKSRSQNFVLQNQSRKSRPVGMRRSSGKGRNPGGAGLRANSANSARRCGVGFVCLTGARRPGPAQPGHTRHFHNLKRRKCTLKNRYATGPRDPGTSTRSTAAHGKTHSHAHTHTRTHDAHVHTHFINGKGIQCCAVRHGPLFFSPLLSNFLPTFFYYFRRTVASFGCSGANVLLVAGPARLTLATRLTRRLCQTITAAICNTARLVPLLPFAPTLLLVLPPPPF